MTKPASAPMTSDREQREFCKAKAIERLVQVDRLLKDAADDLRELPRSGEVVNSLALLTHGVEETREQIDRL